MLTRIKIDGFKTYEDFVLDLSTFQVILGPNAAGKSNLFDCLQLLSRLAHEDLRQAFSSGRGDLDEQFRRNPGSKPDRKMRFELDVLLDPFVEDPWGTRVELSQTRLRYVVEIERRLNAKGIDRPIVIREEVLPIRAKDDAWARRHPASGEFRARFLRYGRKNPFLETISGKHGAEFKLHHDGHQGRNRPATSAEATILSSISSAEFRHLFALREELRSWRFVQLDPAALRRPVSIDADDSRLQDDGSNLAAVLARIQVDTRTEHRPAGILPDIAARLGQLVPGVVGVEVERDEVRREFRVIVKMRDGDHFSARVASDGTLRLLALLTMLLDPHHRGLVYFEEPENGVHPTRLHELIELLRELVMRPSSDDSPSVAQLILNSHSPVVLKALEDEEILFADVVDTVIPGEKHVRRRTRIRGVQRQAQRPSVPTGDTVSHWEVERILGTVGP